MAKASRNKSHIEEQMENNILFETWTQNWGIRVYPAYGIDKLKFSFIEKGAQGKGKSFDIYVECVRDGAQCFDNWAYDITHGRLERVLAAEKQSGEKYPKTYKYTTGENAEKSIGIMNSTNGGYCVNASVPGPDNKKIFANIPVTFHDLRHIAERYIISYAPRLTELEEIRKKAALDQAKWNKDEEKPAEKETPTKEAPKAETPKAEAPKPTKESEPKKEKAAEIITLKLKTTSPMTQTKNGQDLAIQAVTESGEAKNIIFLTADTEKVDDAKWSKFLSSTKNEGCKFTGKFTVSPKGTLMFKGF